MSKAGFLFTFVAAGAVVVTQAAEHPMGNMSGKVLMGTMTQGSTVSHIGPGFLVSPPPPPEIVNMVTDEVILIPASEKPGLTVGSTGSATVG
jgi:hypothetical protein